MPGVSASEIEPLRDDAHDQGAWMSSPPTPQVRSLGAGYWLTRNVRRLVRSPDGSAHRARRSRPTPPYARLLDVWAEGRADAPARERPPAHRVDATRNASDASPSTSSRARRRCTSRCSRSTGRRGLGPKPLTSITREVVKTQLGKLLAAGLSPGRARGALNVLRACLTAAVEDGLLPGNPAARLGKRGSATGSPMPFATRLPPA
jgi:hypothetical protein